MIVTLSDVKSIVDGDGAVILDISRNRMTTLDATGAYVWKRLELRLRLDSIIQEIAQDTGVATSIVERDVYEFVTELESLHLISAEEPLIATVER